MYYVAGRRHYKFISFVVCEITQISYNFIHFPYFFVLISLPYVLITMQMARAVWLYYMAKIVELLDTVFFVLRKKQSQVSFLHVYHHTLMPFCAFIGVKYFAGKLFDVICLFLLHK